MDDFDLFFREVRKLMEDLVRELDRSMAEGTPFFYGVKVTVGPEGVPKFERITPRSKRKHPHTEIRTLKDRIYVIMELQGITDPKNVKVICDGNVLKVRAREGDVGYAKNVVLPFTVDPTTLKATLRNGVLEVSCTKGKPGKEVVVTPR